MPVIPDRITEQLDFSRTHAELWGQDPAAIGLSAARILAITAASDLARQRYTEAEELRLAARSATIAMREAIKQMHTLTAEAVRQVRLFAETTRDDGVYARAGIPLPAHPSPAPAPGQPKNLNAVLNSGGSLTIRWKPEGDTTGVFFTIRRRLPGERRFSIIGTAGTNRSGQRGFKSFIDHDLPAGVDEVRYTVQAQRGGAGRKSAESAVLLVSLGNSAVGPAAERLAA
ncbi:MAG: fibronectin type III domain-containing protein [Phycisphaerales bacterium]|nr:fibronectin type III domain-containing protein [Phycisphaerales bacterium]